MSSCPMCWLLPLPPSTEHTVFVFFLLYFRCLENTTQCVITIFTNLPEIFESRITFTNYFFILSYPISSEFCGVSWASSSAILT